MVHSIPHRKSGCSPRPYYCKCRPRLLWHVADLMTRVISFLASTHYTNYNPLFFAVNLAALIVFAIIPKLPQVRA